MVVTACSEAPREGVRDFISSPIRRGPFWQHPYIHIGRRGSQISFSFRKKKTPGHKEQMGEGAKNSIHQFIEY